ncbi:MAG: universal stress protein [Armatimonadetes bacterium]|nr:universal stress protein [Armatimonadota bacterium]MBI2973621.1 universal stress protein [Armatimonadota bacterium]
MAPLRARIYAGTGEIAEEVMIMVGLRKILAATDLSAMSPEVLKVAVSLALRAGAELTVLHVFHTDDYLRVFNETAMPIDDFIARLRADVEGQLPMRPSVLGIPVRIEIIESASTPEGILSTMSRIGADMIVMGTHGRTGLRRTFVGSVAEEVLRNASVPVLVVPERVRSRAGQAAVVQAK